MKTTLFAIGLLGMVAGSMGCYATVSGGHREPGYYVSRGHYYDDGGVRVYRINGVHHTYDARTRTYIRYNRPAVRVGVQVR